MAIGYSVYPHKVAVPRDTDSTCSALSISLRFSILFRYRCQITGCSAIPWIMKMAWTLQDSMLCRFPGSAVRFRPHCQVKVEDISKGGLLLNMGLVDVFRDLRPRLRMPSSITPDVRIGSHRSPLNNPWGQLWCPQQRLAVQGY